MDKYFSIGEVSKIHNISIEALRHYDRQNILNPDFINESTGYRYYSTKSFTKISLIKLCKALGLSLEEIKDIVNNYTSLDSIVEILDKQQEIIDTKILELSNIKSAIKDLRGNISDSLSNGLNKVFIKENEERVFVKYPYERRYTKEFELVLRKAILDVEKKHNSFNPKIAFEISSEKLMKDDEIIYTKTMLQIENKDQNDKSLVILPKGRYLTLYFDDAYYDTKKYYNIIMDYIIKNNITTIGDFFEVYVINRLGTDGMEKSLGQIDIMVK